MKNCGKFMKYWLLLCVFILGCGTNIQQKEYRNIDRVFLHDRSTISFMSVNGSNIDHIYFSCSYDNSPKFISDVPKNEKMWIKILETHGINGRYAECEVHIHSMDNIEGGSWNRGKFGQGRVNVVE